MTQRDTAEVVADTPTYATPGASSMVGVLAGFSSVSWAARQCRSTAGSMTEPRVLLFMATLAIASAAKAKLAAA